MRILITNADLHVRGGVQSFVRGFTRGLERLGHSVMVYGSDPAQRERLIENDVIPVATDLENMTLPPDIIHAQHHLDAMTALTALPTVPAIFHCHGASWRTNVIKHPRVYRYLAMSRTLAGRMAVESNIAPADIEVFLNAVELARFPTVRVLPLTPTRALFYNSRHNEESHTVRAVRTAASRVGLTVDFIGHHFGKTADFPERLLPEYDIVFASGLSAIEALVCGCAVVVVGRTSCGSLIQPENFDQIRQVNFSIATNSPPPSADRIEAELRRYSADRCAGVSARARREADLDRSVTRLIAIYEDVIDRHRAATPDPRAESLATSRYLRGIVPLIKMTDDMLGRHWSSATRPTTFDELSARVALVEQRLKKLQ